MHRAPPTQMFRPHVALLSVVLAACGGAGGAATGITVRDSAGIAIVEHSAEAIAALPVWEVDGAPILDLGSGDDPAEEFASVRAAVRLSDGRLYVAEGGTSELRLFSADGRWLATPGRRGDGPGEFRSISLIQVLPGDTVAVLDANLRRHNLFDPNGAFLRQITHPQLQSRSGFLGIGEVMRDGRLLGTLQPIFAPPTSLSGPVSRDTFAIVLVAPDGARIDTLALVPGFERFPAQFSEGGQSFASYGSVTFGRSTAQATDRTWIAVGTNEANEVWIYDAGGLRRVVRDATPPEPVTEAHRAQRLNEDLARIDRMSAPPAAKESMKQQTRDNRRHADAFPFYERLLYGTDGTLWVEAARRFEDQGRRYVVYGTDGQAMARVVFPDRVRPLQVGPSEMVGMWRDPDDVPHVRVWRVRPRQP